MFISTLLWVFNPLYFGNREGCIFMIGNLNVLINLFDKIFINPAKQIK